MHMRSRASRNAAHISHRAAASLRITLGPPLCNVIYPKLCCGDARASTASRRWLQSIKLVSFMRLFEVAVPRVSEKPFDFSDDVFCSRAQRRENSAAERAKVTTQ